MSLERTGLPQHRCVTGASSGIGRAIARRPGADGMRVVAAARRVVDRCARRQPDGGRVLRNQVRGVGHHG
ncbi:SDR family NAD(P)-dependent oxidoreductase [Nocardia xishanensis]|uniref:SDR family NAD(P)-dependent oxidoreductase n=1 Tax=Nocardia xishanensis TaxID=238964 RepID=UPI0035A245E5